jgi:hypothetical protein
MVFELPAGRRLVASALVAGRDDVWTVVADHVMELWYATQIDELGEAIGQALWSRLSYSTDSLSINSTLRRMDVLGDGIAGPFVRTFLDCAEANLALLRRLPVQERMAIIRLAESNSVTVNDSTLAALISSNDIFGAAAVARTYDIKPELRARALVDFLVEHHTPIDPQIPAVLAQDKWLTTSTLQRLCDLSASHPGVLGLLLQSATPQQTQQFLAMADTAEFELEGKIAILLAYLSRGNAADAYSQLRFLNRWLADYPDIEENSQVADKYCDLLADACLCHSLVMQSRDSYIIRTVAGMAVTHERAAIWERLLTTATRFSQAQDATSSNNELRQIINAMPQGKQQTAATQLIADTLLGCCKTVYDINLVLDWLERWALMERPESTRWLLSAAERYSINTPMCFAVLRWLMMGVETGTLQIRRGRFRGYSTEFSDSELQAIIRLLIRSQSEQNLDALAFLAKQCGSKSLKWWLSVDLSASSRLSRLRKPRASTQTPAP